MGTRLGETVSPERRAGRDSVWVGRCVVLGWVVIALVCLYVEMYVYICMMDRHVCVTWDLNEMMGNVEVRHVKLMSELELMGHVNDMRWGPILMGWWWSMVRVQHAILMRCYFVEVDMGLWAWLIFSYWWFMPVGSVLVRKPLGISRWDSQGRASVVGT